MEIPWKAWVCWGACVKWRDRWKTRNKELAFKSRTSARFTLSFASRYLPLNQSWTLCWTSTARCYRRAPLPSPSPRCPCLSCTTTSATAPITRPPSSAGISPPPRKVNPLAGTTARVLTTLLLSTREGCVSFSRLPMMTIPQTQHLHLTPLLQLRSPHHPCCLQTAPTQTWLPPVLLRGHTFLTCHRRLLPVGASPFSCLPFCTLHIPSAPSNPPQIIRGPWAPLLLWDRMWTATACRVLPNRRCSCVRSPAWNLRGSGGGTWAWKSTPCWPSPPAQTGHLQTGKGVLRNPSQCTISVSL